jgi:penicillin amidase
MASNNWVISGEHTKNGRALLASDPHLGTGLPSIWSLQHLEIGDEIMAGSSMPGVPLILIGRTKDISWGATASVVDVTDLFREEVHGD